MQKYVVLLRRMFSIFGYPRIAHKMQQVRRLIKCRILLLKKKCFLTNHQSNLSFVETVNLPLAIIIAIYQRVEFSSVNLDFV